ncbi:hypothetical protein B484DRAFT_389171 [Ochromonadaceae sp. CCMP2298]|nr:hypothetical protein B484DRAFT_389171 [Ochromonadaceae sp. CCMP2298]
MRPASTQDVSLVIRFCNQHNIDFSIRGGGHGYTCQAVKDSGVMIDTRRLQDCTSVGVAGFSLHGGVHFGALSEFHGLAVDNILGLTAVVANGSVVTVDLWFALRGAGSSFALVTQLHIQVRDIDLIGGL